MYFIVDNDIASAEHVCNMPAPSTALKMNDASMYESPAFLYKMPKP